MKKFNINVKVINNNKEVFNGTLYEWFLNQEGGETSDILNVVHLCLPLINGESNKIIDKNYNTGEWIIEKI